MSLVLGRITSLPTELKTIIYEYIPVSIVLFCEKEKYVEHHPCMKSHIVKYHHYENYIRDMIRKDCDFVFALLLHENYRRWLTMNNYVYRNNVYCNYLQFLKNFCIENESNHCRSALNEFLSERGLSQNLHKKNTVKNIIWRNWT